MMEWWGKDSAQWFKDCVWTYDPRRVAKRLPAKTPFDPFPKQEELLYWMQERVKNGDHGVIEKSRDLGVSWIVCGFSVWQWLFNPGSSITLGSYIQDKVDQLGVMDALFPKMRMILDTLPSWMLPKGFNRDLHDNYMRITSPQTGSELKGAVGDNIGRGGRSTIIYIDEHSILQHAEKVDASASQNADCIFYIGTATGGMGTLFAFKRFSGAYPVFTFKWQDDPRKDQDWYEKQKGRYTAATIAQEIDIDYTAAVEDVVIPAVWVKAAVKLDLPGSGYRTVGLDVAAGGGNENCYILRHGPLVLDITTWKEGHSTDTAWRARDLADADKASLLIFDYDGPGDAVAGTLEASERRLSFNFHGVHGGSSPTNICYSDAPELIAYDRFKNFRAEMWWNLRVRFWKTWEHVHGIRQHPLDELISIPNDRTLITQLSLPRHQRTDTGKIKIQSKEDMKKEGIPSPDRADALALAFANVDTGPLIRPTTIKGLHG